MPFSVSFCHIILSIYGFLFFSISPSQDVVHYFKNHT